MFVERQGISLRLEGQTNTSGIGPELIRHAAHGGGGSSRSGGTSRQHELLLYLEKRGEKKPCLLKKVRKKTPVTFALKAAACYEETRAGFCKSQI